MQPAELINRLVTRPKKEMIGIAQHNRSAGFFQHLLSKCLDRTLSTDRHKSRGVKSTVSGGHATGARASRSIFGGPHERELV